MYIMIPVDSPAVLVDRHIHEDARAVISDALGGAWPTSLMVPGQPMAVHLRDDCMTAGLGRNRLASVLYSTLSRLTMPIVGPAVLASVLEVMDESPGPGVIMGVNWCLPADIAESIKTMADDMWHAIAGNDHLITPPVPGVGPDRAAYAAAVRGMTQVLDEIPLTPGYPYPATVPRDRIAEGLAKHGVHVYRQAADTNLP